MKKLVITILLCLLLICSFGLIACEEKENAESKDKAEIIAIYNTYVAYADEKGTTPLPYEEWLESVKGETGLGIKSVIITDNGNMIVTYTDDSVVDIGNVFERTRLEEVEREIIEKDVEEIIEEYFSEIIELKNKITELENENAQGLEFCLKDDGTYVVYVGSAKELSSITIPATYKGKAVSGVGVSAFSSCTALKNIIIPDSVKSIGEGAFYGCSSLEKIEVSANNEHYKSIDGNLYSKDGTVLIQYTIGKQDNNFIIPNSVITIGNYAFRSCYSLENIVISNSVTDIERRAFNGCRYLKNVVMGNGLKNIGDDIFMGCYSLENIYYCGTAKNWQNISLGSWAVDSSPLLSFYSETKPTSAGNFWHYVNGEPTVW